MQKVCFIVLLVVATMLQRTSGAAAAVGLSATGGRHRRFTAHDSPHTPRAADRHFHPCRNEPLHADLTIAAREHQSLADMIHTSDVVLTGMIISLRPGPRGTQTATVFCYYAYKRDWGNWKPMQTADFVDDVEPQIEVYNFPAADARLQHSPPVIGRSGMFFLSREPDQRLALRCEAGLRELRELEGLQSLTLVLTSVWRTAIDDMIQNYFFVPPVPDPCENNGPCSEVGSFCSVRNTLPEKATRCTCLTGYYGDGYTCEGCENQCLFGARCHNTVCDCSHINCSDVVDGNREEEWVCGTNGISYPSHCHLRREACLQQQPLYLLHQGRCKSSVMEPCGDYSALLLSPMGVVMCSHNTRCPPHHFCHPTYHYSVCCKVAVAPTTSTSAHLLETTPTTIHSGVIINPTYTSHVAGSTVSIPDVTPSPPVDMATPARETSRTTTSMLVTLVPMATPGSGMPPDWASPSGSGSGEEKGDDESMERSDGDVTREAAMDATLWDDEDVWRSHTNSRKKRGRGRDQ